MPVTPLALRSTFQVHQAPIGAHHFPTSTRLTSAPMVSPHPRMDTTQTVNCMAHLLLRQHLYRLLHRTHGRHRSHSIRPNPDRRGETSPMWSRCLIIGLRNAEAVGRYFLARLMAHPQTLPTILSLLMKSDARFLMRKMSLG